MTTEEALGALEQDAAVTKLSGSMLMIALLRAMAKQSPDAAQFLATVRDDAMSELEAARFSDKETSAESQVREHARTQIAVLTTVAASPDAGSRLRGGRPQI